MTDEITTNAETISMITDTVMNALIKSGAVKPPKSQHKRVNWERLLMYEWVGKFYADKPHWFRIEVGPIPGDGKNPLYARTRRWADAIIRMPDHMLIIEAKMKPKPDVVSQLLNYRDLYPQTPLFTKYKNDPVKLKIVCAMVDDETRAFIERNDIEVEVYKPSNFDAWYKFTIEKNPEA